MAGKLGMILMVIAFFCGCRQPKKNAEVRPNATATPQLTRATVTPTPAAEATPFLITDSTKWKTVEEFDYQWKADQPVTHFKLEIPDRYDNPGDFIRIYIHPEGHAEFVMDNSDGWIEYVDQKYPDIYTKLKEQSLVQSKYVLILPHSKNSDDPPLVFLRSWGYASNAERLHIVGLKPSGDPFLLLNNEFALEDFIDLDGDGIREIVGFPCLSEGMELPGFEAGTYHPLQAYKINSPIQKPAELSIPLTERLTRQKYNGWAGPDCSQDHYIVEPNDKSVKSMVIDQKQFDSLELKSKH
jgi:hypothetical protein